MRDWLKKLRIQKGWTQRQTADALCVATTYYNMIECGKRQNKMTIDMAQKIATAFDVPLDTVLKFEKH